MPVVWQCMRCATARCGRDSSPRQEHFPTAVCNRRRGSRVGRTLLTPLSQDTSFLMDAKPIPCSFIILRHHPSSNNSSSVPTVAESKNPLGIPKMTTPESTSTISWTPSNRTTGETHIVPRKPGGNSPEFENDLCSRCSNMQGELRELVLADPLSSGGKLCYRKGIEVQITRNSETKCSLCRLFRALFDYPTGSSERYRNSDRQNPEIMRLHLFLVPLVSSTTIFLVPRERIGSDMMDNPAANPKYLAFGLSSDDLYSLGYSMMFRRGLFVPKISAGSSTAHTWSRTLIPFPQVSEVNPFAVSFSSILGWLLECDGEHSACCRTTSSPSSNLPIKCIDCDSPTFRVVAVNGSVDYLALSYVWGNPQLLKDEGIPMVVQDAMTVTKRLGKRYLWVDKYCVEQENHDLRALEIQAMDKIYEGAYATIFACAGSDASFGLQGVGGRQRKWPPQVSISPDVTLSSALPPLHAALRSSTWITRGWTYQEAVRSRRTIFFTHFQVYFACGSVIRSEALPIPESLHELSLGYHASQDTPRDFMILNLLSPGSGATGQREGEHLKQDLSSLEILTDHISRYTSRKLSYDEDILNAFRAILSRSPVPSFWGIPVASHDEDRDLSAVTPRRLELGFLQNLFCLPLYPPPGCPPLLRRDGFPSWS